MNVVLGCCPDRSAWPKTLPAPPEPRRQRLVYYHNASQKQAQEKM